MTQATIYHSPFSLVGYVLFTKEKDCKRYCKKQSIPLPNFINAGNDGTTHFFRKDNGWLLALVCVQRKPLDDDMIGLIVHEAAHIWQALCEEMGERNPSEEFEAYSLQTISRTLLSEYRKQIKGKKLS